MAGLLDWLTDGSFGGGGGGDPSMGTGAPVMGGNTMPPVQPTGQDAPPLAPPPAPPTPPPDPTMPGAGPQIPPPPTGPTPSSMPDPNAPAGGGPVPMPMARPPDIPPPGATPSAPPPLPTGAPPPAAGAPPPGPPMSLAPANPTNPNGFAPPPSGPSWAPDQQGRGGLLSRAMGLSPDQSNRLQAAVGAGMTAAGNSAGKSPFQALASGAGATMEGASKEQHANTKDALSYLDKAMTAQKNGDTAAYNTNMMQYHLAKLKSEQETAASATAANKNDSPTQLYLAAQRNVAADPMVHGALESYKNALKNGSPQEQAAAKAILDQTTQERQAAHLAGVGLHPQTAAEVAKNPGMTQANPVDASKAGITPENIGKKLQPGQFYTNPADIGTPKQGTVYQFKGVPTKSGSSAKPAVNSGPKSASQLERRNNSDAPAADAEDDE